MSFYSCKKVLHTHKNSYFFFHFPIFPSNAWDDAAEATIELFLKSRLEVLFQYRKLFKGHHDILNKLNSRNTEFYPLETGSMFLTSVNLVKNLFFFCIGIPTMGILWPTSLRHKILSAGMSTSDEDDEK